MALTKITKTGLGAGAVDSNKIEADSIDATKIADNAVSDEHLDITSITGQTELSESAAGSDVLLIYDASAGTLKKIQASNVGLQSPTLSSISPTNALTGDGTGNVTFTFTGTGFIASAVPTLITDGGSEVTFDSFTIDSQTQISATIAVSSLSNANEPYDARVTVAGALTATLTDQINIDAQPVFNTSAGSVGSFSEQTTISTIDIEAYDPDSAGNVTFEIQSGSLPAGLSATTVNENGVSKYRITGTLTTDVASLTTSNFTLRAVDAASNTSSRAFSITELPSAIESFTSSGTFSVPSGITSIDVLVVAGGGAGGSQHGGGGGAGGLIFMPGFPVTPGGTVSVTVGCGGTNPKGYFGPFACYAGVAGSAGADSVFGTLTAKGGGGGGSPYDCAGSGGSGGGAAKVPYAGGTATQPTQPGQSGAYGFGSNGGASLGPAGAGGGGAGAVGSNNPSSSGGPGGAGKAYTIADGTTPVYYAGGGGGGDHNGPTGGGTGGQGGGGDGGDYYGPADTQGNAAPVYICASGVEGQANKGGGGGGGATNNTGAAPGGKGIVIVKY